MPWQIEITPCDRPAPEAAMQTHAHGSVWKCACGLEHVLLSTGWVNRPDIQNFITQVSRALTPFTRSSLSLAPYIEPRPVPLFLDIGDAGELKAILDGEHYLLSGAGKNDFENALGSLWAQVRNVARVAGMPLDNADDDTAVPYFAVHDDQIWLYAAGQRKALTTPGAVTDLASITKAITEHAEPIAHELVALHTVNRFG